MATVSAFRKVDASKLRGARVAVAFTSVFALAMAASAVAAVVIFTAASVAEAQTPGSNNNYVIGNSACSPNLQDVTVTVKVTTDLVSTSSCGAANNTGFSMQLNVNAPNTITNAQSAWQQYVVEVGKKSFTAHTQLWSAVAGEGFSAPEKAIEKVTSTGTVPAGYTVEWKLTTDASTGNVRRVTYKVTNSSGKSTSKTVSIPIANQAPIAAYQLDFVGYSDGCIATFTSGAGTITYEASSTDFNALGSYPSCSIGPRGLAITAETSTNGVYGLLPSGASTKIVQDFSIEDAVDVSIQAPEVGTTVPEGVAIPLVASAMDAPDANDIAGESIAWTSSTNARFTNSAAGCSLLVTFGKSDVGTDQTLTATATNAFGETGEDKVKVNVVARPAGPVPEVFPLGDALAGDTAALKGVVSGGTGTVTAVWTDSMGAVIGKKQAFTAATAFELAPVDTTYGNGTETVTLTVTDSADESNKATLEFTGIAQPK
jgi:hypothetical protein